jgi:7-carboxy-7-deazaguanine synthase
MDIKCPSSGMQDRNDMENLERLTEKDELKFVIGNREDYDYAKRVIGSPGRHSHYKVPVHLSPVFNEIGPKTLAEWILEDHLDVRLHLQIHKIIWGPDRRGV